MSAEKKTSTSSTSSTSSSSSKSVKSLLVRSLLAFVIAAGAVAILYVPVREVRREWQVKECLLTIQSSLQDYHVAEELYPRRTPMKGADLVRLLIESGHMKREEAPHNPYTGRRYVVGRDGEPEEDQAEVDGIVYKTDSLAETYSLKALTFEAVEEGNPDGEVLMMIDSTEHPSLE